MIYLDNNATTKPFPEVVDAMLPFMSTRYWNASSAYGQLDGLEDIVESAKSAIRSLIASESEDEVVFTSGATESNVWAIAEGERRAMDRGWVLSSQIEHPSITESLEALKEQSVSVRYVPVTRNGTFDLDILAELVDSDLRFASLMLAHNETGVIQPIREVAKLIRERSPHCLIHSDATQAIGKMPVSFSDDLCEVDLISFSGHKFHGPKGIGGLVIRNGTQIQPLIRGGGQQNNLRSGTINVPAIAGIAVAAKISREFLERNCDESVRAIRDEFEEQIRSICSDAYILGLQSQRLPNTSFFGFPGTYADDLVNILALEGIALSTGSSCSSKSIEPAKTARLMAYTYEEASTLLRFSASPENTSEEVGMLVDKLYKLIHNIS